MSRNEAFESGKAAKAEAVASGKEYSFGGPYSRDQDIMLNSKTSPGGATSATIGSSPSLTQVKLYKGKQNIGMLDALGGEVFHIETASDFKRQGVATEAFRLANFAHGRSAGEAPIKHGTTRTPSGDAWAKSTGDKLPEKVPSFGISASQLENRK